MRSVEPMSASERLLQAIKRALEGACPTLETGAVGVETPLAALFFDSLTAVTFIARLEEQLGVRDLPFEGWLREHSEATDLLTIGSLVTWLGGVPALQGRGASRRAGATSAPGRAGNRRT